MNRVLKSSEEMGNFAKEFLVSLKPFEDKATVVGLYGDLGAGKTTFTQAIAETLGIGETVVSPTFVIMKRYEIGEEIRNKKKEIRTEDSEPFSLFRFSSFHYLIHIDAYRLEKSSELTHLGWQEIISDPTNLVLIEWPERVADIMPEHVRINFEHVSENERQIEVIK